MRTLLLRSTTVMGAALLALCLAPASQAQVTIGAPGDANSGNEFPFGTAMSVYQQVYAASDFSGPIMINGVTFFNTTYLPGSIQSASYDIQLSTTAAAVNGLSNTFADNLGADNTTVFHGTLSGPASPSFTIPTSLFDYQPMNGNLLLTIRKSGLLGLGDPVFLDARNGTAAGLFSRKYSMFSTTTADNAGFDSNWGLVTQFEVQPTSAVPEPGSVALLAGLGVTGSLFALRRLRRHCK